MFFFQRDAHDRVGLLGHTGPDQPLDVHSLRQSARHTDSVSHESVVSLSHLHRTRNDTYAQTVAHTRTLLELQAELKRLEDVKFMKEWEIREDVAFVENYDALSHVRDQFELHMKVAAMERTIGKESKRKAEAIFQSSFS